MRRLIAAAPLLLLALAACDLVKVERTPASFYTQRDPAHIDQQDDSREIRARVSNFAAELGRGHRGRALAALNPVDSVLVIGSDASTGMARIGPAGLAEALDSVGIATPAVARTPDLRVQVRAKENTGWFSTPIEFIPTSGSGAPAEMRASGVFTQDRGEWKLVQLHLSRPYVAPDTTRRDTVPRDTTAPRRAGRDSAAATSAKRTSRPRG